MNTSFKSRLLQHFLKLKQNKSGGFTLIELLVVIIIIGILAAIALPSFLNQANKARQTEAKTYIGSMNRAQQAYYLEQNEFSDTVVELALGINDDTENYSYEISSPGGDFEQNAANIGGSDNQATLKDYVGGAAIGTIGGAGEATTLAVLCEEAGSPGTGYEPEPGDSAADLGLSFPTDGLACDEANNLVNAID